MTLLIKQCSRCKKTKHPREFYTDKFKKSGLSSRCVLCNKDPEVRLARIKSKEKYRATPKGRAKSLIDGVKYRNQSKKRSALEKTLTIEDIFPAIKAGQCQLTGLPFDFYPAKVTHKNPYSPSLDRIDSQKGYTKENVRVVLSAVNDALGEHDDKTMLPILEAMVKGIKKNAKKKSASRLSNEHNSQSENHSEFRTIFRTRPWENCDGAHHSGGAQDEDLGDSPTESSPECLGAGVSEVGAPMPPKSKQDNGQSSTAYIWLES
jgi:hypothetical protein